MFDFTKEVPSLELCKKLKELGYPQNNGGWYWLKVYNRWRIILDNERFEDFWDDAQEVVKAPTVRELGCLFPEYIDLNEYGRKGIIKFYKPNYYVIWDLVKDDIIIEFENDGEANIRAKILIWLVENGYISFNKQE